MDSWHNLLRLIDSTPVPCAASRETVKRSDLAGHAGYGYCASHSRFFWGFRLYLPIIWGLANPKFGEREVTQALLERDHHLIHAGQVILGDKGFAGKDFETFVHDQLGAHLIRPDRKNEPARFGNLAATANESKGSSTPSKDNSPWNTTAHAPSPASTPPSPPASSPSQQRSGTTGTPEHPPNAPLPPTTTKPNRTHSSRSAGRCAETRCSTLATACSSRSHSARAFTGVVRGVGFCRP